MSGCMKHIEYIYVFSINLLQKKTIVDEKYSKYEVFKKKKSFFSFLFGNFFWMTNIGSSFSQMFASQIYEAFLVVAYSFYVPI